MDNYSLTLSLKPSVNTGVGFSTNITLKANYNDVSALTKLSKN